LLLDVEPSIHAFLASRGIEWPEFYRASCVLYTAIRCFIFTPTADKAVAQGENNNDVAFHSWSGNEHGHLAMLSDTATASDSHEGALWADALPRCICGVFGAHYMTRDPQVELQYQQKVSGMGFVSLWWLCRLIQC